MALLAFSDHPFIRPLSAEQASRLLPSAREKRFATGAFIFREGAPAETFYLLRSGRVALEQHVPAKGVLQVESLGEGDILGLSWLLPGGRWTLDARAVAEADAFVLAALPVRAAMAEDPTLGRALATELVHALYQRLVRVRLQRFDVYESGR